MTEVRPGKQTLVERGGTEFEPPDGHTVALYEGAGGPETYVALDTPQAGSLFHVREIEERGDSVVVHLGEWMGSHGPASFGSHVAEPTGYPFPE